MIEINVPTETAVNLLSDQMRQEIESRKKMGKLHPEDSVETVNSSSLREILETSIFDIVVLLPVTLITEKSNLSKIIITAVRNYARQNKRTDLNRFTEKNAKIILKKVKNLFSGFSDSTSYQQN